MKKLFIVLSFVFASVFFMAGCTTKDEDVTPGDVAVASIAVTGAASVSIIDSIGGTLQMSAIVLPTDATDDLVLWTVANGTGTATISSTGVLTHLPMVLLQ